MSSPKLPKISTRKCIINKRKLLKMTKPKMGKLKDILDNKTSDLKL